MNVLRNLSGDWRWLGQYTKSRNAGWLHELRTSEVLQDDIKHTEEGEVRIRFVDVIDEADVLLDGMKTVVDVERFLVKGRKRIDKSSFVVQIEIGDHESSSD